MNTNKQMLLTVLCAGMFIYGGCAKQQSVKVDQPIAPSATTAAAATAPEKPAAKAAAVEPATAPLPATAISSSSIPPQSQSQQTAAQSGASQTAAALETIYFGFDSAVLDDTARATLAANLEKLKANPKAVLKIEGHSDERGSDEYNLALSERRAQSAMKYLQSLGFPAEKLSVLGYGEEKPAVKGEGEEIWAKNRRDEFVIAR